jgi:membrane protease YdiL (CAAX protease family)
LRIQSEQKERLLLWGGLVSPFLMALAGALLAWLRFGGAPDWLGPVDWSRVAWAPVVAVLSLGATALAARLWPAFGRRLKQSGTAASMEALQQVGYPVMLAVVAGAALGEELLFRGGVQPWLGVVGAALLFGLSHGGWRPREMWAYVVAAALSGLLFGWFYGWAGTIWAPVIAHLCHNVTAVLFLGRRVEFVWKRGWPRVRLVPEAGAPSEGPPVQEEDSPGQDSPEDGGLEGVESPDLADDATSEMEKKRES